LLLEMDLQAPPPQLARADIELEVAETVADDVGHGRMVAPRRGARSVEVWRLARGRGIKGDFTR
jgi:hypothetical protein